VVAAQTVTATIPVGSSPAGIGTNPAINRVYVANQRGDSVSVTDGTTNNVIATIPVGFRPTAMVVDGGVGRLHVANEISNNRSVLDGSGGVVATIPVGISPVNLAVNPATGRVHVSNSKGNSISAIQETAPAWPPPAPVGGTAGSDSSGGFPRGLAVVVVAGLAAMGFLAYRLRSMPPGEG
jgi:YVTN family beta-propeller protein